MCARLLRLEKHCIVAGQISSRGVCFTSTPSQKRCRCIEMQTTNYAGCLHASRWGSGCTAGWLDLPQIAQRAARLTLGSASWDWHCAALGVVQASRGLEEPHPKYNPLNITFPCTSRGNKLLRRTAVFLQDLEILSRSESEDTCKSKSF